MERIVGKFDDLNNKARPGSINVSGFTLPGNNDDLRVVDVDGSQMRFIPASRYYASCTIKRGQAVSIAQLPDLNVEQRKNKYHYVKITDPDIDETCIGIAMNYATEGQIVHIQSSGKFNYYTTKSLICNSVDENGIKRCETEIFLKEKGWNFDTVRGQRLFLKKLFRNPTNAGETDDEIWEVDPNTGEKKKKPTKKIRDGLKEPNKNEGKEGGVLQASQGDSFDTDHAENDAAIADPTEWFTFDLLNSIYNAKNTIQLGYLTDAPSIKLNDKNQRRYISYTKQTKEWQFEDGQTTTYDAWLDSDKNEKSAIVVKLDSEFKIRVAYTCKVPIYGELKEFKDGDIPPKANEAVWLQEINTVEDGVAVQNFCPVDDQVVTIELDVTGDTRGPVDNTQFVVTLGEPIYFDTKKKDEILKPLNYNEGIYDELKVLAIAQGNPRSPGFRVFNTTVVEESKNPLDKAFIALRKLDGDTFIIPVLCNFTEEELNGGLVHPEDEGYYKLSKQFTAGPYRTYRTYHSDGTYSDVNLQPSITISKHPIKEINRDNLKIAISTALTNIFAEPMKNASVEEEHILQRGSDIDITNIGDDGFFITTKRTGGYYDVYISKELLKFVTVTQVEHGQSAEAGTAILADIRDTDRLNVIGIVLSNQSGVRHKGETVKVIRTGRIVTMGNVKPGTEYFLGLNGHITAKQQFWYDHCLPVGLAESSNYFLVDISPVPMHSYAGNLPIGYIKPSVAGRAEKGFILCNGGTKVYSKEEYSELYHLLLNWFDESELRPSSLQEETFKRYQHENLYAIFDDIYGQILENIARIDAIRRLYSQNVVNVREETIQNATDIFNEIQNRKKADDLLGAKIDKEIEDRKEAVNDEREERKTEIKKERDERVAKDTVLENKIDQEKEARETEDKKLLEKITDETAAREEADETLTQRIEKEGEVRKAKDEDLADKIFIEAKIRDVDDTKLREDLQAAKTTLEEQIKNINKTSELTEKKAKTAYTEVFGEDPGNVSDIVTDAPMEVDENRGLRARTGVLETKTNGLESKITALETKTKKATYSTHGIARTITGDPRSDEISLAAGVAASPDWVYRLLTAKAPGSSISDVKTDVTDALKARIGDAYSNGTLGLANTVFGVDKASIQKGSPTAATPHWVYELLTGETPSNSITDVKEEVTSKLKTRVEIDNYLKKDTKATTSAFGVVKLISDNPSESDCKKKHDDVYATTPFWVYQLVTGENVYSSIEPTIKSKLKIRLNLPDDTEADLNKKADKSDLNSKADRTNVYERNDSNRNLLLKELTDYINAHKTENEVKEFCKAVKSIAG